MLKFNSFEDNFFVLDKHAFMNTLFSKFEGKFPRSDLKFRSGIGSRAVGKDE